MYPVYKAKSLDETLPYPHYSNEQWFKGAIIFGEEQAIEQSAYADRLRQWDSTAAERADNAVAHMQAGTARRTQEWLSAYHQKPVRLIFIHAMVAPSNGYSYYFYGYEFLDGGAAFGQEWRGK